MCWTRSYGYSGQCPWLGPRMTHWRAEWKETAALPLAGKEVKGVVNLSWDQDTSNGLGIKGSLGELRVDPNEFRWIEFRKNARRVGTPPVPVQLAGILGKLDPKTLSAAELQDCIYIPWVQFLRAVTLDEPVPVDGRAAIERGGTDRNRLCQGGSSSTALAFLGGTGGRDQATLAKRNKPVKRIAILGAAGFAGTRFVEFATLTGAVEVVPIIRSFKSTARLARFGPCARRADAGMVEEFGLKSPAVTRW